MKQEDKELLFKDLCARIPYKLMVKYAIPNLLISIKNDRDGIKVITEGTYGEHTFDIEDVKPYLRPLTSLTKEERQEIGVVIQKDCPAPYGEIKQEGTDNLLMASTIGATNLIDWFNANHFDYRGLIEKGLALEAPEDMYDIK